VLWPVGLLAGVITVTGIPAAIEDGLLPAISAPLFLFGLVHRLLLLHLRLLLHLGHQAFPFLLQALPHLRHRQLCIQNETKEEDEEEEIKRETPAMFCLIIFIHETHS